MMKTVRRLIMNICSARHMRMAGLSLCAFFVISFFTSCLYMPKEEESKKAQVINSEETVQYVLVNAERGDVQETANVYCTYSQLSQEDLYFGTDGRQVMYVYFDVGDRVKAGDLLASLYIEDIDDSLNELKDTVKEDRILIRQEKETRDLGLKLLEEDYDKGKVLTDEYNAKKTYYKDNCEINIESYEHEIKIDREKIDKLSAQKEGCLIYAGMDGTVSYVRTGLTGSISDSSVEAFTIIDTSECAFISENMDYAQYYKEGDQVTLYNSNGTEYETTVMPISDTDKGIRFKLNTLDFELAVGTKATAVLVLNEVKDCIYVPRLALHHIGDDYFVYVDDGNGIRSTKSVEVGLIGNGAAEIKSGLKAGDSIIRSMDDK